MIYLNSTVEVKGPIHEDRWSNEMYDTIGKVGVVTGICGYIGKDFVEHVGLTSENEQRKVKRWGINVYIPKFNETFNYSPKELFLVKK